MKSRKRIVVGFALTTLLLVGGCSPVEQGIEKIDNYTQNKLASISIPFEWFKSDEQSVKELDTWKELTALKLPDKDTTAGVLKEHQTIVKTLEEQLLNPVKMNGFLSRARESHKSFDSLVMKENEVDVLGNVLRDIHKTPHQTIGSITLTGDGHVFNKKDKVALFVSLNVVNDNKEFLVYPLMLTLNEQGKIDSVRQVKKEASLLSTPSPLTDKSELAESVHKEFGFIWNDFKSYPKTDEWTSVNEDDFLTWMSINGVEEREDSVGVIHKWFKDSEGDLSRAKVTGYVHTDEKSSALTLYEISYPKKNNKEHQTMTIRYDRGLNKIISIKSGSPFYSIQEEE